eukprot:3059692-Pleurochrysis_carterae.AAC.1
MGRQRARLVAQVEGAVAQGGRQGAAKVERRAASNHGALERVKAKRKLLAREHSGRWAHEKATRWAAFPSLDSARREGSGT